LGLEPLLLISFNGKRLQEAKQGGASVIEGRSQLLEFLGKERMCPATKNWNFPSDDHTGEAF